MALGQGSVATADARGFVFPPSDGWAYAGPRSGCLAATDSAQDMHPHRHFRHCPRCGRSIVPPDGDRPLTCTGCGFRLYFNPAVAVAVFIQDPAGRVLLIRRAKDPGAGQLAPPGGFIDRGERAEDAVHREVYEEVGLRLTDLRFLGSQPNEYPFAGVLYPVLDLFFTARLADPSVASGTVDPGEVDAAAWHAPGDVRAGDLAFPSMRAAWQEWLRENPAFAVVGPGDRVAP